jgi:uncharacterized protein (DUF1800 family)
MEFGISPSELNHLSKRSKAYVLTQVFSKIEKSSDLEIDLSDLKMMMKDIEKKGGEKKNKVARKKLNKIRRQKTEELNNAWVNRMDSGDSVFTEKMTLFWTNVFVCRDKNVTHLMQYHNTLRRYSLGNFNEFVKAIAKEPSMNKYLNNKQNVKGSPNENFARELMELFTIGIGNYTEQDIKESARAFTGWSFNKNGEFFLKKKKHDFGEKTFMGKTGDFDGNDIIDIILEQKETANFICTKIYKYFVNPEIDKKRLEEITDVFYNDYDIYNLMNYIFSSDWFYDDKNIGVKIKSPIELLVGINRVVPTKFVRNKQLVYLQKMMGQELFYPPNVAGWKQNRNWIDSNTLMFRLKLASMMVNNGRIDLAEKGEYEDSYENFYKKKKGENHFLKTVVKWDYFQKEYGKLEPVDLQELLLVSQIDDDTKRFLSNLKIKNINEYCVQLMSIPEYQLC